MILTDPSGMKAGGGGANFKQGESDRNEAWGHDPDAPGFSSAFNSMWKACAQYCTNTSDKSASSTGVSGGARYGPGGGIAAGSLSVGRGAAAGKGEPEVIVVEAVMPPSEPEFASLEDQLMEAYKHRWDVLWFSQMVRSGGAWGHKYAAWSKKENEPYRNFNYGAVGAVLGIPLADLLQWAGIVQRDRYEHPEWGSPGIPGFPSTGSGGFGDQPGDPYWIVQGFNYGTIWLKWWP